MNIITDQFFQPLLLGFLTNIRGAQLLIIAVVILLLFGAKRLPDIARSLGKALREFKDSLSNVEKDFRESMDSETKEAPNNNARSKEK